MGTFTSSGKEYHQPAVPADYDGKPGLAKAWKVGWNRGIYSDFAVFKTYRRGAYQAAHDAGLKAARDQRRAAGEQVRD